MERTRAFVAPPDHRSTLDPVRKGPKVDWEDGVGDERRLAERVRRFRHDDLTLASLLEALAPWQRIQARVVLVRELGAARGDKLWRLRFGGADPQFLRSSADSTELEAHGPFELARVRAAEELLEALVDPRLTERQGSIEQLLGTLAPRIADLALSRLARRNPEAFAACERRGRGLIVPASPLGFIADRRAASLMRSEGAAQTPQVRKALSAIGRGNRLSGRLKRDMERVVNADLSGVQLHVDERAAAASTALGVRAFSVGDDIFFAAGAFAPWEREGRRLLARELGELARTRAGREAPIDGGELERRAVAELDLSAEHRLVHRAISKEGQPLPTTLRGQLERALDVDLSAVTVHTGPQSSVAAAALGGPAFTVGQEIHFAGGRYDPHSEAGVRLIAHEVAHTVQQRRGVPELGEALTVSSPSDHHEVEAEDFANQFPLVGKIDLPRLVRRVRIGSVQRSVVSLGPAPGTSSPAYRAVLIGDVTVFDRKSMPAKTWSAGTGQRDLLKKQISVKGVPLNLALSAEAKASARLSGGYGPGVIKDVIVELAPGDPAEAAFPAMQMDPAIARATLLAMPATRTASGFLRVPADGGVNVDALAKVVPNVGTGPVSFGVSGGLEAHGKAGVKAEAGIGVGITHGPLDEVSFFGLYDLDVILHASFNLDAFVSVFVELDLSKDFNKPGDKKGGGRPGIPFGMNSIPSTKPPGWPKEIPWILPEPGRNPLKPGGDKWRKEWKKTWRVAEKAWQHPWELDGKVGVSSLGGSVTTGISLPNEELPMTAVIDDLFQVANITGSDPENIDKTDDKDERPTPGELEAAKAKFDGNVELAKVAVDDEVQWTHEQIHIADHHVRTGGPNAAAWTEYKTALRAREAELDEVPTAIATLESRATSAVAMKDGTQPERQQGLDTLVEVDANASELIDLEHKIPRPEGPIEDDPAKHIEACYQLMKEKITNVVTTDRCFEEVRSSVIPAIVANAPNNAALQRDLFDAMKEVIEQEERLQPSGVIEVAMRKEWAVSFREFQQRTITEAETPALSARCEAEYKKAFEANADFLKGHVRGIITRSEVLHDEIIAELGKMREGLVEEVKPLCTDAVKEYFSEHDVDSDTQGEILESVDGCCVDEVKDITDRYQDEILRKARASAEVIQALSPLVDQRWVEAGKDALRERMAVTDPRMELINASRMAIYPKHLQGLGKSKDDAIKAAIASKWGQYWNCAPEAMVRETLLNAPWVRADSTVHAYLRYGPEIGFEGKTGNPAHLHRAELTNADPPEMHGHPRVTQGDD